MRNRKELRAWFEAEGLPISRWALQHGFKAREVYALLAGRTTGVRGRAHEVAVALGIKPAPKGVPAPDDQPLISPVRDRFVITTEGGASSNEGGVVNQKP